MKFYNKDGDAICYTEGNDIILHSGESVAYIDYDKVYSWMGDHIGWYKNDVITDLDGYVVFFNDSCRQSSIVPVLPIKRAEKIRMPKKITVPKGIKKPYKTKMPDKLRFISYDEMDFFKM